MGSSTGWVVKGDARVVVVSVPYGSDGDWERSVKLFTVEYLLAWVVSKVTLGDDDEFEKDGDRAKKMELGDKDGKDGDGKMVVLKDDGMEFVDFAVEVSKESEGAGDATRVWVTTVSWLRDARAVAACV